MASPGRAATRGRLSLLVGAVAAFVALASVAYADDIQNNLDTSKEALDAAGTGAADATHETFAQLDELLATLA